MLTTQPEKDLDASILAVQANRPGNSNREIPKREIDDALIERFKSEISRDLSFTRVTNARLPDGENAIYVVTRPNKNESPRIVVELTLHHQ